MKKGLLFSLMATFLAGLWFGGVSLAASCDLDESYYNSSEKIWTANDATSLTNLLLCEDVKEINLSANIEISQNIVAVEHTEKLTIDLKNYSIISSEISEWRHAYINLYWDVEIKWGETSKISLRYLDIYWNLELDSWIIEALDSNWWAWIWVNPGATATINWWEVSWWWNANNTWRQAIVNEWTLIVNWWILLSYHYQNISNQWTMTINWWIISSDNYTIWNYWILTINWWTISSSNNSANVVENIEWVLIMTDWVIEWWNTWIFIEWNGDEESAQLTISWWEIKWQKSFGVSWNWSISSTTECQPWWNCWWTKIEILNVDIDCTTHGDWCLAIYHPQNWTLDISWWTFKWQDSAIEVRAGKMNIAWWTFTTVTDSVTYSHNGNGNSVHGATIAVSQHTTYLPIEVNISWWEFNWNTAFIQVDPEYNAEKSITKVETKITSWTFNWSVSMVKDGSDTSENKVLWINWWIFSLNPSDYIEEWYAVLEKESKFYVMSLADAATDESNTANVQLPEWVTVNTWAWDVTMDLSDDITAYLSWDIDTAVSIEDHVLTWEIQDEWYQWATVVWAISLDFWWNAVFSKPIAIRIPNVWENDVRIKVKHGTGAFWLTGLTLHPDINCNDDWSVNGVAAYTGWEVTPINGFAVIYTCSASTFVAYTETGTTSSSTPSSSTSWWWGGGWGGSSSSYSCKSLPVNAVANNTSKPKKDTNYSYSTDTSAVCTFQCKTGYTRNEKDEKCEKSSETLTDTDKEGTEKIDTTNTSDTAFEDLRKVLDDGYTVEFHNAYNFAFKNGITTMPNIQAADMNSPLTRIAMAKMLSQYAINVLKKTPDTTKTISFPDVSAELDAEYSNGVTLAYQLWIMWINIEEFRPFDTVTRAEFATALSRLLFWTADGENLYYETHMQKLLDEKIITITDPNMQELRGYVMIMLMRSAENN